MMTQMRVNDYFPNWLTGGGIITALCAQEGNQWASEVDPSSLDLAYHGARSGKKITNPLLDTIGGDEPLDSAKISQIAKVIYNMYGDNWNHLWETLNYEYEPIENYDMEETSTDTRKPDLTDEETRTPQITESETRTPNLTEEVTTNPGVTEERTTVSSPGVTETESETRTPNLSRTEETQNKLTDTGDSIYGFNSQEAVPTDTSKTTESGTVKTTDGGTEKTERTLSKTGKDSATETLTRTGSDSETRATKGSETTEKTTQGTDTKVTKQTGTDVTEHTLRRHGNIGVTTSQQMIEAERQLWFWNFMEHVFSDVDRVIACPIY